jgi:hypothetical protein
MQIHYITESIRCCGAGTAADTEYSTALIASNMEMLALQSGRKPRVVTAMTMLKQMLFRYVSSSNTILFSVLRVSQTSRAHRRCSSPWRCRSHWASPIHYSPTWFHRQTSLCDHGIRQPGSDGYFRKWLETRHGGNLIPHLRLNNTQTFVA